VCDDDSRSKRDTTLPDVSSSGEDEDSSAEQVEEPRSAAECPSVSVSGSDLPSVRGASPVEARLRIQLVMFRRLLTLSQQTCDRLREELRGRPDALHMTVGGEVRPEDDDDALGEALLRIKALKQALSRTSQERDAVRIQLQRYIDRETVERASEELAARRALSSVCTAQGKHSGWLMQAQHAGATAFSASAPARVWSSEGPAIHSARSGLQPLDLENLPPPEPNTPRGTRVTEWAPRSTWRRAAAGERGGQGAQQPGAAACPGRQDGSCLAGGVPPLPARGDMGIFFGPADEEAAPAPTLARDLGRTGHQHRWVFPEPSPRDDKPMVCAPPPPPPPVLTGHVSSIPPY
jgi:hypothetical protein